MTSLATSLFDYHLPDHLIAQTPAARRDESRLLVVNREKRSISHHRFKHLSRFLNHDDTLIRNNAAVLPARLRAHKPTGGAVECLLLRPEKSEPGKESWWCLLRPGKRLPQGSAFALPGVFSAWVNHKKDDGVALIDFEPAKPDDHMTAIADRWGEMPLPPYLKRSAIDSHRQKDLERYQTVYANREKQVAVAAPTAGLHFTPEILDAIERRGTRFRDITLHVGLGTFRPVTTATITDHEIHHEIYEMPDDTQQSLLAAPGRRVAVGTTTVRAIEHFLQSHPRGTTGHHIGNADIFIIPPRDFAGVDALITNFHQPRSTLLCLVSAFLTPGSLAGIAWIKEIYAEAIEREYRFFSYGDAMLIL